MISTPEHKTAAVIVADLERTAIGTPGRAAALLAGTAVLTRTLRRVEQAAGLHAVLVFCPAGQKEQIAALAAPTRAKVIALQEPLPANGELARRKWALESWRGGIGEAVQFDEQRFSPEMTAQLRAAEIEAVVSAPAEAVLIDPALLAALVAHHHEHGEEMRFTFTQAAPGLAACVYRLDLLEQIVQAGASVGQLLAYKPDAPEADLVNQPCTLRVANELCTVGYRFLADTERAWRALEKVAREIDAAAAESPPVAAGADLAQDQDARRVVAAMAAAEAELTAFPRELEIEITTAATRRIAGYPHGRLAESRGPMSAGQFAAIVAGAGAGDDLCLTIGGFGEPLAHPDLPAMIQAAHEAGVYGVNVETDGRLLRGGLAEQLLASDLDTITVMLDADTAETYRAATGGDDFATIVAQMEAFIEQRNQRGGGPLIVPQLTKTRATMNDMEAFYDRWRRRVNAAVIVGYNDFAGQIEDRAVMDMSPPERRPCRRLFRTLTILADGTAVACGQDFAGQAPVGNAFTQSLEEIWRGGALGELREHHRRGRFDRHELCPFCKEWQR